MGTRNANLRRGMDKSAPPKVIDPFEVNGYRINLNEKTRTMQIVFFHKKDGPPIARMYARSDDAYNFAHDILKKYDILEGLNDQ